MTAGAAPRRLPAWPRLPAVNPDPAWRKASWCARSECVEVSAEDLVLVRDSKNPDGPALSFTRAEWKAFTASLKG